MKNVSDDRPRMITLPRFLDPRGNLSVIEQFKEVPFTIERCYWVYDVPGGDGREGHAYRRSRELVVALSGSFEVAVDRGGQPEVHVLNRCYQALYIPSGTWREFRNFSTNAVALVVASEHFDEADYMLTRDEYFSYLMERGDAE